MSKSVSFVGNMPKEKFNGQLKINSTPINSAKSAYTLDSKSDFPGPYDHFYDENGSMKPFSVKGNMTREDLNRINIDARVGLPLENIDRTKINSEENPFARGGKSKRKRRKTKRKKSKNRRRKSMRR
jgi:hypothetical protein